MRRFYAAINGILWARVGWEDTEKPGEENKLEVKVGQK